VGQSAAPPEPPKRRVLPPVYFFACIAVMVALDSYLPGAALIEPPLTHFGWIPFAAGFLVALTIKRRFDRDDTPLRPGEESTALVTDGLFAHSRNPIYLAMIAGLLGIGVVLGTLVPFAMVPLFAIIIRLRFIPMEEEMLEDAFGDEYRAYKSRVRRWL
jgi:protein-S-isoprenylcysteine O-methyltransferase Ste14